MKSTKIERRLRIAMMSLCMVSGSAFSQSAQTVTPDKNGPLKLYDAPGQLSSDTASNGQPLPVAGAEKQGFIPVLVNNKHYWVDGMDVRRNRQSNATCTLSAGKSAAGTLGAATNRCPQ
jgi:hypothetical protein